MTVLEFLETLKTADFKAVIKKESLPICTIYTYGVGALDEQYQGSKIESWEIIDRHTIVINLLDIPSA